jgi:hypothetical protein
MRLLPHYIHIVKPRLKHIYLTFNDEGTLVIKSPKISQKHIEQLLLKKASWINKSRDRLDEKKGKALDFGENGELYFLGKAYPLKCIKHEKKRVKLHFDGEGFTLCYYHHDKKTFQKHIDVFYRAEASKYILPLVQTWSKRMQLYPNKISFRKTKRQWGSCSVNNNLSFNTMMMKLPEDVIQYIIVHELSHIKYKHHQKSFWQLIEIFLPHYKMQVQELKKYTT